jgi:hypothetical protein
VSVLHRTLGVVLIVLLAACSGGDDGGDAAREPEPEISERSAELPEIELRPTRSEYVSPHREMRAIPEGAARDALDVVQRLFEATVVDAAVLGEAGDATELFTPDALEQVRGTDYRALVDTGVGPLEGLEAERANVGLAGLAGQDDQPQLIVAVIDWDVHSPDGAVRIKRNGELSLVPAAGGWRIAAYSVLSERTVDGSTTTTKADWTTTTAGGDR